jgi:nicotinamidase-related amidase
MAYELNPARTALLVIDAQREYFDEDGALYTPRGSAPTWWHCVTPPGRPAPR